MSNGSGQNTRWCNACWVKFTVQTRRRKDHYFCPLCGECIDVVRYEMRDKQDEIPRKSWTTKEEAELRKLVAKGKQNPEIASILKRTLQSIRKKILRLNLKG